MASYTIAQANALIAQRRAEIENEKRLPAGFTKAQAKQLYTTWEGVKARCLNPNSVNYARYGARGILLEERWHNFILFAEDLGPRPAPGYTLDRLDPKGNYERGNVRWATALEQAMNKNVAPGHVYGVRLQGKYWVASGTRRRKTYHLYCGDSYYEAVVARKEWEKSWSS